MANDPEEKQPSGPPQNEPASATPAAAGSDPASKPGSPDPVAVPPVPVTAPTVPATPPTVPVTAQAAPPAVAAKPPAAPVAPAAKPPAVPAAPKPPPPPKEGPVALDNELVKRYREKFGAAIREAWIDRKQAILVVDREQLETVAIYSRDAEKFDWLSDLTAVDWPNRERRFDVVLNMYSFEKNERLRVKVHAAADERVPSVQGVWATANWLEREVYDMFGIVFEGHPDLTRILMPDEWIGHPLRKDYDILQQDTAWVRENLGIESGQ